jgi:membrane-associated phospholipid phosphatase
MQTIRNTLKHSLFFLIPYGVFLVVAGIILALYSKEQIHLSINSHYSAFADFIMPYMTWAGDGYTICILVILLGAWNRRFGLWAGISALLASGVTQALKIIIEDPRPKLFFTNLHPLRLVPGVNNYLYDSFPSGHTTVAFAFYFSLVFLVKNNYLKLGLFLFAMLVGYSRIYLSQHFLGDVFAGSLIGTITSFVIFTLAIDKGWLKIPHIKS